MRYIRRLLSFLFLRAKGVETGLGDAVIFGLPLISRHRGSRIVIGKGVTLISNSRYNVAGINHPVILATVAEGAIIELRDGCGMSGGAVVAAKRVTIGRHSGVGANSSVYDTDFHHIDAGARRSQSRVSQAASAPVDIGDDVWLCAGVTVLKGVTIGDRAVVGAGAVVVKDVEADTIVAGNPARVIRDTRVRE